MRVTVVSLSVCQHLILKMVAFHVRNGHQHELGDDLSLLNVVLFKKNSPYLGEKNE